MKTRIVTEQVPYPYLSIYLAFNACTFYTRATGARSIMMAITMFVP